MRKALVQIHLWLGLVVGLFWALQGLTGAGLVFHRELDRLSTPTVAGPMISMDRIAARAPRPVQTIGIADSRGDLLNVQYKDGAGVKQLQVEAATGRIAATRDYDPASPFTGSASRWLYLLHESLLLHDRGETLVGISGLLLFTALLSGLWIGWPRRRQWRAAFAWRHWRTTRIRLYGWHRMVGLLAGALLVVTVPGGIWMIFAADLRPALAEAVPHQLPYKPRPVSDLGPVIAPQAALERARSHFPDAAFVRLTFPTPAAPVYAVRLRQEEEVRAWSGVTSVTLDARTGRVVDIYDPVKARLSNRLADAAFSIHSAEIAGLGGRILLMLAGLSLPALYVTGIWAWLRKRRRRKFPPQQMLGRKISPSSSPASSP